MICPFCNNSDLKIVKGYWKLSNNLVFNSENGMYLKDDIMNQHKIIVLNIINLYLDCKYSKEEKYIIGYVCNNCDKHFDEEIDNYFFIHYILVLEDAFEAEYEKAFVNLFGINSNKLFNLSSDEKIDTLDMFFDSKEEYSKRLFLARDIWYSLPKERGGGADNSFDINTLTIVLSIVSAFLYDVLKLGLKKPIKN